MLTVSIPTIFARFPEQPIVTNAFTFSGGQSFIYNVSYFEDTIRTTVTADPRIATNWIADIESEHQRGDSSNLIVGLDIEWRPPFGPGHNPTATLQLCVGNRCLIFQLLHSPYIPAAIRGFLASPDCTFVGVEIQKDLERLQNDHGMGLNTNARDLREWAGDVYENRFYRTAGLKTLVANILGKALEKSDRTRLSNWDAQRLLPWQVGYACVDAFVSHEIALSLAHPQNGGY